MRAWGAVLPEGSRGRAPGQGIRGQSSLKLNTFLCFHMPEIVQSCYVYELFYGQLVYMHNSAAHEFYLFIHGLGAMAPAPPSPLLFAPGRVSVRVSVRVSFRVSVVVRLNLR